MGPENPNFEERGNTVKKSLLLLACIVVLALGAAAQENLNFSTFPLINTPMPTPNGYGQLNWTNVFYVDPYEWSGGGSGFRQGPVNKDVAFVSGEDCLPLQNTCFGMVTSLGGRTAFQPVSAILAGGFGSTNITITAYNNGQYVGTLFYSLTSEMQTVNFPASWGSITQLTFQTSGAGDLVIYDLTAYTFGG